MRLWWYREVENFCRNQRYRLIADLLFGRLLMNATDWPVLGYRNQLLYSKKCVGKVRLTEDRSFSGITCNCLLILINLLSNRHRQCDNGTANPAAEANDRFRRIAQCTGQKNKENMSNIAVTEGDRRIVMEFSCIITVRVRRTFHISRYQQVLSIFTNYRLPWSLLVFIDVVQ